MAFTLASTTDTQEQVDHAASENWREAPAEPAAEPAAENQEGGEGPGGAPETGDAPDGRHDDQAPDEPRTGKRPGGFQKRITKLTGQIRERDDEIERLNRLLASRGDGQTPAEAPPSGDKEPNPDEFQTVNEYLKALTRWEARQAQREMNQTQANESETERQRQVFSTYNKAVADARGRYEDFDEVVGSDSQIPQSAAVAIIESENGPDIAYWLGKNPDAAERLSEMSPAQAAVEIGRLSERLARPAAPAKPTRQPSAAPAPASPVRGSAPQNAPNPTEVSFRDYVKGRRNGTIR